MSTSLNVSSLCLSESRPPSAMGYEKDAWIANSDSCLLSSSSRTSSLTEATGQKVSCDTINDVFSFQNDSKLTDQSLRSITEALQTEKDFMDYVMSFPADLHNVHNTCCRDPKKSPNENSPKVGLDHLDNLCKLMEQLSDLKESNVKLKKRVQYLEDLKTLHEIHREMMGAPTIDHSAISEDEHEEEKKCQTLPKTGISGEAPELLKERPDSRDFGTKLYRSKTTTIVESRAEQKRDVAHCSRIESKGKARERSKSVGHPGHSKCKKRASRWSKVKEVLGIEKTNNDDQNSISGAEKDDENDSVDLDSPDYPRIDSRGDNQDESTERPRSMALFSGNLQKSDESLAARKKSPKTPWGKMKTIIQSRKDCRAQKSESSSSSSKRQHQEERVESKDKNESRRCTRCRKASFKLQDPPKRHQHDGKQSTPHYDVTPPIRIQKSPSKQLYRRSSSETCGSQLQAPRSYGDATDVDVEETDHRCICEIPSRNASTRKSRRQASPTSKRNSADVTKLLPAVWDGKKQTNDLPETCDSGKVDTHGSSSQSQPQPCPSATVTELLKELQKNLSEDFNKKLEEWQRFRGENPKSASLEIERKESFGRFRKLSKPEKKVEAAEKQKSLLSAQKKNLNWLDKELPKIEREILRLSKEKQKFEKRSFHLRRLKDALTETQNGNEVLIRTSAGEFRFEGISNAFTKKLYEWETRKGVRPELSTIALLDESLKPLQEQATECRSTDRLSVTMSPDQTDRLSYQMSKASSEPDLSALLTAKRRESNGVLTSQRSKSGDTLLGVNREDDLSISTTNIPDDNGKVNPRNSTFADREDSYYSLLEENIFLLDQLKDKEETCCRLQNELDRLVEKFNQANKTHQEELENSRRKLWEIHMSRPRDLQGSLQLLSELKTRIEELETCSDKLKCDREKLEESYKHQSEEQRHLAEDLLRRITELQQTGSSAAFSRTGCKKRNENMIYCEEGHIQRIHELSTSLLQQARDMQSALADRTRQVCHLRWELLHRDMAAVLLQAALHRVTCQGPQAALVPTWNMKRIKFKELKAWSIDTSTRRQSENTIAEDWLQERLKQLSLSPCNEWTSVEFNPNELLHTAHELKKETFQMSKCPTEPSSNTKERKKTTSCSAESETVDSERNYGTGSAFNSRSSSLSSGPLDGLRSSHSDTRLYERSRSQSIRRHSSSSMSCISGFDASESSSLHDSDKIHSHFLRRANLSLNRKKKNRWHSRENVSSSFSSRSSGLDEDNGWAAERYEVADSEELMARELKYESFREVDEEDISAVEPLASGSEVPSTSKPWSEAPTYSLLKSLISHPSYTKATNIATPNSSESIDEPEVFEDIEHNEEPKDQTSYVPHFFVKQDRTDATSYNSSNYTSAESLDHCSYVTHKEQQLFLDIRNLAISCETDTKVSNSEEMPQIEKRGECPLASESDNMVRASNITQIKYKGTKGFGRTSKTDFSKYQESGN